MKFKEFWPLYLRAHRLPGTRGLHYFATAIGILSAIEAIAAEQPLIFVIGIAASYAIAISAHWFVERNQPLIGVNAFLGAVADLRMCWLALSGRMEGELARYGVLQATPTDADVPARAAAGRSSRLPSVHRFDPLYARCGLLIASTAGLTFGLTDLSDLTEPMEGFGHPVIQLGAPIVAFAGALIAAFSAIVAAQRYSGALGDGAIRGSQMPARAMVSRGGDAETSSANERSLRRTCLALLALGSIAFGLAELAEHGLPDPADLYGTIAALATLLCVSVALIWQASTAGRARHAIDALPGGSGADFVGPNTRGLRVDGRVQLVDMLENLLSFGRRHAILAATLDAANLRPGDRLIDVGCGTGELVLMAASIATSQEPWGESTAMGIDATPGMIEIARRRAREASSTARFEVAVAEALPSPDESADAVTSTFFFHHLPTELKREAMREMWRVLAPGGRLVIADYGWAHGLVGLIASLPMRFNFHEYVRGQLDGELERLIELESLGDPQVERVFLGYIRVLRIVKPHGDFSAT